MSISSFSMAEAGRFTDERMSFELFFDDYLVVAAGARSRRARRRTIKLAERVNEPWALPPPESELGGIAKRAFRARGLDYPRATVASFPTEVRMNLLASGRFLTIVPSSAVLFPMRCAEVKALPVELPQARIPVGIFTLKHRTLNPTAKLFIDYARDVAKPLAKKR